MWEYVDSSNVAAVKTDGNDLWVKFHSGGIYVYYGAADHFDAMVNTSSVGSYFHANVKNSYDWNKL